MTKTDEIKSFVQNGNTAQTVSQVKNALNEKITPAVILREGLIAGITELENKFYKNEILVSDLLFGERAMRAGIEILLPYISEEQKKIPGTIITGTPEGDILETGNIIIINLMQSLGLKVIDLGTSVPTQLFIRTAIEEKAQIIACTTSLLAFLPRMKALVQAAGQANIRGRTKILVSGRPVTMGFSKSIDADMYAPDLIQAADMAAEYCKKFKKT